MLPTDIWHAYLEHNKDGKTFHTPAGRFLTHDGHLFHLEDYHGLLENHVPTGVIDDYTMASLAAPPKGLRLASRSQLRSGYHTDLIPEDNTLEPLPQKESTATPPSTPRRPAVWHYFRAGHSAPHVLEAKDGQYLLDGNRLSEQETGKILENLHNKTASLKYPKVQVSEVVAKHQETFDVFETLRKMDLEEALAHFQTLGGQDEKSQKALHALRQAVFVDPMTGLGNRVAFETWSKKDRPGVHGVLDANFFKGVNDTYGHPAGDAAIKAYGKAIRDTMDEVAPKEGAAHRIGGDEFQVHFPTHEHAALFGRKLAQRLEQIPYFGGTHRASLSMGIGADHHMADAALYEAKRQKQVSPGIMHQPHTIPHLLFHSLVPGHEGAVKHEGLTAPSLPTPTTTPAQTPSAPEVKKQTP